MNMNVLCRLRRVGTVIATISLSLFLSAGLSFAQSGRSISGKVTDPSGAPVIGAGVLVHGTSSGTTTDSDGSWTLSLRHPDAVTLDVSSLGYRTSTVVVPASQTVVNIVLEEDMTTLDDVVVVAYGTQKRASLTGAISSVSSKAIKETRNENVVNMLSGKMAGVRVVQTSGEPGSFSSSINIRGWDVLSSLSTACPATIWNVSMPTKSRVYPRLRTHPRLFTV